MCYMVFMDSKVDIEEIKRVVLSVLRGEGGIAAIYLFGSVVDEYFNENSDIDVAILFKDEISFERELDIGVKLERSLERRVDLINLSRSDVMIAFEAISKGVLIYEGDYIYHSDFLERLFREYADVMPRYIRFMKELKESM